ncbi:MAG: AAA family ATPase [Bacteroidia bacterium]|nr:AAA family ATPase [Bacteroidia bacterium]
MKIHVQNLGALREAEIELKPLTVFIGKNNTHKSYVAHVVYGVFAFRELIFRDFLRIILLMVEDMELGKMEIKRIANFILSPSKFIKYKIFGSSPPAIRTMRIRLETSEVEAKNAEGMQVALANLSQLQESLGLMSAESRATLGNLYKLINAFSKYANLRTAFYFPASRTSFLQMQELFIRGLLALEGRIEGGEQPTLPVMEFIRTFFQLMRAKNEGKNSSLLQELKQIMGGTIWIDPKAKRMFFDYESEGASYSLPITHSSSAVTELAPLYLYIQKNDLSDKLLIIEEPEAHLHPENQVRMARFLVKLVEAGAWVLITTHSDYIFSELSNQVRLYTLGEKSGLPADKLAVYLFERREDSSEIQVKPIEVSPEEGIVSEYFDEVMNHLLSTATQLDVELAEKKRQESPQSP